MMADASAAVLAAQGELLLFAAAFFLLGSLDELLIDAVYLWLRLTGRLRQPAWCTDGASPTRGDMAADGLDGPVAVFIPAWQEALVIGATVRHAMAAWPQDEVTLYVGCYFNDPATVAAVRAAAADSKRVRLITHGVAGPTCKADCLNRLHAAMCADEVDRHERYRFVVLHDAEDMVDPAALPLMNRALDLADFVQLPVLALPQPGSRWISGHYSDEFAEAHGKTMVVRAALGAALPGAGVGCAIKRDMVAKLATVGPEGAPFATGSLVEDYELGLAVARLGGNARFLRVRTAAGRLVATRAYFPATLGAAVRQKTRWTHGIALQGWDRLGWRGNLIDRYMLLRDRRGLLSALLLLTGYLCVAALGGTFALARFGSGETFMLAPWLQALLAANLGLLIWRLAWRGMFTAREHGWRQGLLALPRTCISNIITIMASWRAVAAYCRSLSGEKPRWDKTEHHFHPAIRVESLPEKLAA